jgi:aryl-alcohol dehydrogenase-like predicted oxidoreductase
MVTSQHRNLGSQGLAASPLGLGCIGMSEFYGTPESEAVRTIHRALDLGVTLLDTADMYGPFTDEKLVGRAVREWSGERPLIATKCENLEANLRQVEQVEAVAGRHDATSGQVALAWVLSRGDEVVAIPGTKRVERLEENLGALELELTDEDLGELDGLASDVAGTRYAAEQMGAVGR